MDRRTTRIALIAGAVLVLLGAGLGWGIVLAGNVAIGPDQAWAEWTADVRVDPLLWIALALNAVGAGRIGVFAVPLTIVAALLIARRPWAAAYFLAASLLSAAVVQVLKGVFARPRPDDMIVVSDFGSFPSGHVANAATIAVTLAVVFPRAWVIVAGAVWTLLMALSRTYVGAHWLTDTLGGALIGTGTALVVAAAFAGPLLRERLRLRRVAD